MTSARKPVYRAGVGRQHGRPDTIAQSLLLILAIGVAWLPVESHPWTAVIIALAMLTLGQWGWRRTDQQSLDLLFGGGLVLLVLACSGMTGWDPSRAVGEIGLVAAMGALFWLASRSRPPEILPALLAIGLTGLAFWGIWQVFSGLEAMRPGIEELASPARAYAEERIANRRAFASLPLPSHLAVLLATALPLLLVRARATPRGMIWFGAAILGAIGLVATRSPVGLGLALLVVIPTLVTWNRLAKYIVAGSLVIAILAVIVVRPDVASFEPVSLRFDNWRTGVWLWSTSPASGIGVASFAQASQANPLEVGNRPAHAHSLPVEGFAELGPVGLIGVVLLAAGLFQLVSRLWKGHRGLAVAVVVVPLHNLLDFSLFVSGVALPWAVLLGWAAARLRSDVPLVQISSPRGRTFLVAVTASALGVAILHASSVVIEESAASSPDSRERFEGAMQALRIAPWRIEPQFLLATSAIDSAEEPLLDHAWHELDGLRWVRPRSAALAQRRARLALARGDVSSALAELWSVGEYGTPGYATDKAFDELVRSLKTAGNDAAD